MVASRDKVQDTTQRQITEHDIIWLVKLINDLKAIMDASEDKILATPQQGDLYLTIQAHMRLQLGHHGCNERWQA